MTMIRDVMSTDFQFVTPETPVSELATIMRDKDFGFLPVGESDRLIGMVTDRDIVTRAVAQANGSAVARDVMTAKTYYCYEDQSVDEICDNMAEIRVRRLPVVNREKRLVGIVSLGDISQQANRAKAGNAIQEITVECARSAQKKAA